MTPDDSESHLRQEMRLPARTILIGAGATSWSAGAVATLIGGEGSGAVALIGAGAVAALLGLMGRWPSKISLSGNELSWPDVNSTVDAQIEAAEDAGKTDAVLELEDLRRRLDEMQRTGAPARHPAAEYDEAVESAIRRSLPGATVTAAVRRSRNQADFEVRLGSRKLLVESKFKLDPHRAFHGSTLTPLIDALSENESLLVVTNASSTTMAESAVAAHGDRVRVVSWSGPGDDPVLQAGLAELLR